MFTNSMLLITGGTGSFGHAVLDRFLDTDVREIRIFSRDEKKQDDMRTEYGNNPKIKFYIGDVRDINSVKNAMHGVDYIFHAAALKQVPSCEFFPLEAAKTNIIGTDNVLSAAIEYGVKENNLPLDRQGCVPHQRHGYVQSHDGKSSHSKIAYCRPCKDHDLLHPLRQRNGLPRLRHPALRRTDKSGKAPNHNRARHDALHHEP